MNFEYWLESQGCMDGYGTDYQDAYDEGFDEGQQSQQAKIDCMQVRLDGANERALSILNHKNVMVDKMQAEIDEFKKLRPLDEMAINQLAQANQVWQIKCDELQKRIDDASNKIDFWVGGKNGDAIHVAKSIGNILKGNKDEN